MKKKILVIFLALVAALCLAFGLAACGEDESSKPENPPATNPSEHTHDWGEWTVKTPATCSAQGEEERVCKLDSTHKETRAIAIDPTAHVWNSGEVTKAATCSETGEKTYTCTLNSAHTKTESIEKDPTAHKLNHVDGKEATCSEKGWNAYDECEYCDYTTKVEIDIDPTAHKIIHVAAKEANCTEKGCNEHDECEYCGYSEDKVEYPVVPDKHSYNTENVCKFCEEKLAYTENLTYVLNSDGETYSVDGIGTATDSDLSFPYYYEGLPVTEISRFAFYGCKNIKSVTIHDGIEEVGEEAFGECTNFIYLVVGRSIRHLISEAFNNCYKLVEIRNLSSELTLQAGSGAAGYALSVIDGSENSRLDTTQDGFVFIAVDDKAYLVDYVGEGGNVELPADYKGKGYEIKSFAFYSNTAVTSVTIPDSVTAIGRYAFYGCTNLEEVTLPESITSLDMYTFANCTNLTKINLPEDLTSIGVYAFLQCARLTSITIPTGVTEIGVDAFGSCLELAEVINLSSAFTVEKESRENGAVAEHALRVVNENAVGTTEITADGFVFLTEGGKAYLIDYLGDEIIVQLPESYNGGNYEIPMYAFNNAEISCLIIPAAVTFIDAYAFDNCHKLVEVLGGDSELYIHSTFRNYKLRADFDSTESALDITADGYVFIEADVLVDEDKYEHKVCLVNYIGDKTALQLPASYKDGSYEIYDYAFSGNTKITSVTIPEKVTAIGDYAFANCAHLREITVSASAATIGDSAFLNCGELRKATLNEGVTSIGYEAFRECSNLAGITFPKSVKTTGENLFFGCYSLTYVAFENDGELVSVGDYMITSCEKLRAVYIKDLAAWCNIEFPAPSANPLYRAENLYYNGELVTDLVIPSTVTTIKEYAFANCQSITSITFESDSKLETIGKQAFYNCKKLESAVIPASVTFINGWIFDDCVRLESVEFEDTENWNISVYSDMRNPQNVTVTAPAQNATYFKTTYYNYYWKRG